MQVERTSIFIFLSWYASLGKGVTGPLTSYSPILHKNHISQRQWVNLHL